MNCFYIFQGCIHFILLLPERGVHQRKFVFEFQYGIAPDDLAEADFASLNTTHRQARTSRTAYCNKQTFFVLFFVKLFVHFARQFRGSFVLVYC